MAIDNDKLNEALRDIAVLKERFIGRSDALSLQALEYERRLDELNHAHAQSVLDKAQFLQRDTYEKSERELIEWRRGVDAVLTVLKDRRDSRVSAFSAGIAVISVLVLIVSKFWPV